MKRTSGKKVAPNLDWKLNQNVECRVSLNKLKIPHANNETFAGNMAENTNKTSSQDSSSDISYYMKIKLLADELFDIFGKFDAKCTLCDKYILQLHNHLIQNHEKESDRPFLSADGPQPLANENISSVHIETNQDTKTIEYAVDPATKTIEYAIDIKEEPDDLDIDIEYEKNPKDDTAEFSDSNGGEDFGEIIIQISDTKEKHTDNHHAHPPTVKKMRGKKARKQSKFLNPQTGRKVFKCEICDQILSTASNLAKHRRRHFIEADTDKFVDKPYKCEICGRSFVLINQLNAHMHFHKRDKKNKKLLTCDICGKPFIGSKASNLNAHRLTHMGEKPHQCDMCGKSYALAQSLKVHMKKAHVTSPQPIPERNHTCDVCGKGFTGSMQLKIHSVCHMEVKRFKCYLCEKSFRRSDTLKLHKITHTGEKPYTCHVCGMSFGWSKSLRLHKVSHK